MGKLLVEFLNILAKLREVLKGIYEARFWHAVISIPTSSRGVGCKPISLREYAFKKTKGEVYQFEGYSSLVYERQSD